MKKYLVIIFALFCIFLLKYALHKAWLAGTPTAFKLDNFPAVTAEQKMLTGHRIDINTATQKDLEALPGIGPRLAEEILIHRTKNGPFSDSDTIMDVIGIGPKKYAAIRQYIDVK